mmetsp:Transcript_15722/g.18102  ORF Transcript_15722/g.18102 Transcript_15722/m.18102 type:complete len:105 (-) Transcript_15722:128-442(-)
MGNTFRLVPNQVDHTLSPDKIFAFEEDEYDRSVKNGVIWVHNGGNSTVTSDVTIKQATAEKFTPVVGKTRATTVNFSMARMKAVPTTDNEAGGEKTVKRSSTHI